MFPQSPPFDFLKALPYLFLMSSNTWLNYLLLSHPPGLFPLNSNPKALLGMLVLSIISTWKNNCSRLASNSVNKCWIPTSLNISFVIPSLVCPSIHLKNSTYIPCIFLLFLFVRVHVTQLNDQIKAQAHSMHCFWDLPLPYY